MGFGFVAALAGTVMCKYIFAVGIDEMYYTILFLSIIVSS